MKRIVLLLSLTLITASLTTACAASEAKETSATVEPTPTVRILMMATDPATFVPAAGQPQLVEFFAFW